VVGFIAVSLALPNWGTLSAAGAPPDAKPQANPPASTNDGGLLAGPKVEEQAQQRDDPRMGEQGRREGARRQVEVSFQDWMGLLRGLDLKPEQQTKIRAIAAEFQSAQREFTQSQGEEGRELARQAREARQAGKEPPKELRDKLQKMEADRPKAESYQQRIWAELTEEQRDQFKAKLDEYRQRMLERREQRKAGNEDMAGPDTPKRPAGAADEKDTPAERQSGDGMQMMDPQALPAKAAAPSNDDRARRRSERGDGGAKLDELGQRRLKFLLSHQSAEAEGRVNHPAGEPMEHERQFKFEDDR